MADPQAQLLAEVPVLDLKGGSHPLGDEFAHRPAALLFIRHFG